MAKKYPDDFPFVPICDLPFIWGKWGGNHPIHPIHKYKIGDRLALLALNKYYGRSANGQILYLINQAIREFERTEGAIPFPETEEK